MKKRFTDFLYWLIRKINGPLPCEGCAMCKECKYFVDEGRYPRGYCEYTNSHVYAE